MLPLVAAAFLPKVDSLYRVLNYTTQPEKKLDLVLEFCAQYRTYAYDTLDKYSNMASALAKQSDNKYKKAKAMYFRAIYLLRRNDLDSTYYLLQTASNTLPQSTPATILQNRIEIILSYYYIKKNNTEKALEKLYSTLNRTETSRDSVSYLLSIAAIGWANMENRKFEEAKKWLLQGAQTKTSDSLLIYTVSCFNNLIACYGQEGNLDSAAYFINISEQKATACGDLASLANVYVFKASLSTDEKNYEAATQQMLHAMEIRKEVNDPFYNVSDLAQLGNIYLESGNYKKGINAANQGISIANKLNIQAKLPLLYEVLYQCYYQNKNYKEASDVLVNLLAIKDSMQSINSQTAMAEMQVKYDMSQKEKTIQKQQFELKQKNYQLLSAIVLLLLFGLVIWLVYRSYKHRQLLEMQRIKTAQQSLLTESIMQAEEKERSRMAADLHDGLGQMLTAAKYNLEGISDAVHQLKDEDQAIFQKAVGLVEDSSKEVRAISHNIMPNTLLKRGLADAIKDFIEKIDTKKLQINLSVVGMNRSVDLNTEVVLYRIVQECVNNAIKHSKASKMDISFHYQPR